MEAAAAQVAMREMDQQDFQGRALMVSSCAVASSTCGGYMGLDKDSI